tara:strand:- start:75 stop:737 length:663 start_codon:yes stop_codon:yes gene_type:complete
MLNFYGRKSPRRVNKKDKANLFADNFFFFHHKNINDFHKLHLNRLKLNLEIGFGSGENILKNAAKKNDEFFIGCDPYLKGALILKKKIELLKLNNVVLTNLSFQEFFEYIKKLTFSKIYILFPDPWPKKKHRKRRLINKYFLKSIHRICNKNSKIIISSDDENYVNEILYKFYLDKSFTLSTTIFGEKLIKFFDIKETKYYKKAKNNKKKTYFFLYNIKK